MPWRGVVLLLIGVWQLANAATDEYSHADVMIPMRDGIQLHAQVFRPQHATGPLPILLQRSPYGYPPDKWKKLFESEFRELAQDGFIIVLEDIRGRFGSQGEFVMLRPKATGPKGIDESTDAYDSIDWLIKHLPGNNGAAGVFGVSYMGWTTAMATINPHPALKAVSVQASPEDMFIGDDFHHNGAFRLQYAWEYVAALERDGRTLQIMDSGKEDPYSWLLKSGQLATVDERLAGHALPSWRNFVSHPDYDAFWHSGVTSNAMPAQPAVPNLIVAGWWDQEDFYGPLTIYRRQETNDVHHRNYLVIGPWNHGGWMEEKFDHYGPITLGSDTASYFRTRVETTWFRYWLKHEGTLTQPGALIFETGSNQWKSYDAWPPRKGITTRYLHLHANHVLSFDAPRADTDSKPDTYVSDPANPVPYRARPIAPIIYPDGTDSSWRTWQSDDQTPFAQRPDVLSWQSQPLTADLILRGSITARLFASTTGSDADWVVKLLDVDPTSGRGTMIANDVFRGRYRNGFEHPVALKPGEVLPYPIDLHSASHVFRKGHRIAVQVQSTWFPLIDRNPQVFLPSIYQAQPSQYRAQTHSIWHTKEYPSAIVVDVADR
jgi:uncharacterized protein